MHIKRLSAKCWLFCLNLKVLTKWSPGGLRKPQHEDTILWEHFQHCWSSVQRRLCTQFLPHRRLVMGRFDICFVITVISYEHHGSIKSLVTALFVQQLVKTNIKGNINALHYWPFVGGIHRWLVDSPHKGPVIRKVFPCHVMPKQSFDDTVVNCYISVHHWWRKPTLALDHWCSSLADEIMYTATWIKLL